MTLVLILIASHTITTYIEPSTVYAHSGRTDASGGHRDNKNKSGLGSYHYHCGGHPAHLHANGACPYSNAVVNQSSNSSNKQTTQDNVTTNIQTNNSQQALSDSVDYSWIYDEKTYISYNQDVYEAIGDNSEELFKHFLNNGIKEGRIAIN